MKLDGVAIAQAFLKARELKIWLQCLQSTGHFREMLARRFQTSLLLMPPASHRQRALPATHEMLTYSTRSMRAMTRPAARISTPPAVQQQHHDDAASENSFDDYNYQRRHAPPTRQRQQPTTATPRIGDDIQCPARGVLLSNKMRCRADLREDTGRQPTHDGIIMIYFWRTIPAIKVTAL